MIKNKISISTGILWNLLTDKGILSIKELGKSTGFNTLTMGMALGWLSKEYKINFIEKDGELYVELLEVPSGIYYYQ